MLVIREEQIKAFEGFALRNFENEMVAHIQKNFPQQSEIIKEPGVRKVVKLGMERAGKYDFTNQGPIRLYLELMFLFGSDFDTDPQYQRMAEILNKSIPSKNAQRTPQMERADLLYDEVAKYVEKVAGPKDSYEKEALINLSRKRFRKDFPSSEESFSIDMIRFLNEIFPYKCANTEEKVFYELIQVANELAIKNRVAYFSSVALFVLIMFKFGHGCFSDPQYPWISRTLSDTTIVDPDIRAEKLHSEMTSYNNNTLAMMNKRR